MGGTETTMACPNCDRADTVEKRTGRYETDKRGWYCYECKQLVDPIERESQPSSGLKHGLAKKLDDMDPDAIGSD